MNAHTPRPWTYYNADNGKIFKNWRVLSADKMLIAKIEQTPGGESEHANAALIAAAPDMLNALYLINAAIVAGDLQFTKKRNSDDSPYHPANIAMWQAITKAGGTL